MSDASTARAIFPAPAPAAPVVPAPYTPEWVDLVRKTVAQDATDAELQLFLYRCQTTGLDPLAKQIYFQKRFNKQRGKAEITIITSIDGYRLVADRTGAYAGNDDPVFDDEERPRKATVTVYKLIGGVRCAFTASARWDQYYPGDAQGFMWRKMPHLMIGKCAEALALRKAFPSELSGLYVKEEMDQAEKEDEDEKPKTSSAPATSEPHYEPDPDALSEESAPPPPPPPRDRGKAASLSPAPSRPTGVPADLAQARSAFQNAMKRARARGFKPAQRRVNEAVMSKDPALLARLAAELDSGGDAGLGEEAAQ